jgi:hypothetical protein
MLALNRSLLNREYILMNVLIQYTVYVHCRVHDYYGNINNTCYYDSQQSLMETWIN